MLGIDLTQTSRMQRLVERYEEKFLLKFLCEEEIQLIHSPITAAGFWAIKEATSKALGTGIGSECSFHDIKIYKTKKGAPKIALSKKLVKNFAIEEASVSLSHDGDYAVAVVAIKSSTTDKIKQF